MGWRNDRDLAMLTALSLVGGTNTLSQVGRRIGAIQTRPRAGQESFEPAVEATTLIFLTCHFVLLDGESLFTARHSLRSSITFCIFLDYRQLWITANSHSSFSSFFFFFSPLLLSLFIIIIIFSPSSPSSCAANHHSAHHLRTPPLVTTLHLECPFHMYITRHCCFSMSHHI